MTYATLEKQIRELPEEYIDEVAAYIDYLRYRNAGSARPSVAHASTNTKRQGGWLKGKVVMASDFDAPLDDFKEYM